MNEHAPKTFEEKLDRIDAIVKRLESGRTDLEEAIALFKEGKLLTRECEALLKNAQEQIDDATAESKATHAERGAEEPNEELPF
jgi:exodeoxyribonuclease VII small subunit